MRPFIPILLLCLTLAGVLRGQEFEKRYVKAFPAPTEEVVVVVSRGLVQLVNGPAGGKVNLEVNLRMPETATSGRGFLERLTPDLLAPFKRDLEQAFASLAPRYKAGEKRVELTVRDSRSIVVDKDPALQMTIDVRVEVPAGLRVVVRSVAAGVTADDFKGSLVIEGEAGSCFIQSVAGDFTARTTSGGVTVGEVGGSADIRTASGNILTGRLRGPSKVSTANGSVEVQQAESALKFRGDDAQVVLGLTRPLPKGIDLSTSAGSITLKVDRDLPLTVDASTRLLGKVRARALDPVPRSGAVNRSSLLADLNGGGERVRLRTSWGDIFLVGREPLQDGG